MRLTRMLNISPSNGFGRKARGVRETRLQPSIVPTDDRNRQPLCCTATKEVDMTTNNVVQLFGSVLITLTLFTGVIQVMTLGA